MEVNKARTCNACGVYLVPFVILLVVSGNKGICSLDNPHS